MRYLADILTLGRFILTGVLVWLAFVNLPIEVGLCIFLLGELTDAFDGTLATKFPFPKDKTPKYRKYASLYDMLADTLLMVAMALFFILRVNWLAGVIMVGAYGVCAVIIDLVVYGRILGHPDTAHKGSLMRKKPAVAKKVILTRRMVYIMLIAVVGMWTLWACSWSTLVKGILTGVAVVAAGILWVFLKQRRENISRDAIEYEK